MTWYVYLGVLENAARRMGSGRVPVDLDIDVRRGLDPVIGSRPKPKPLLITPRTGEIMGIERSRRRRFSRVNPIDIELERGIRINDLNSVRRDPKSGLLSYKGRQIVLYIQDQGGRIRKVIEDGTRGSKVHVTDCRTLEEMRRQGRHERYVATNNVSGNFYVTGMQDDGDRVEGHAALKVCQYCLTRLNYRGYERNRRRVFREFKWSEFFEEHRPRFAWKPTRTAGEFDGTYTPNWGVVSDRYRKARGFTCENCRVDLQAERRLLHVHHVNGVKTDNRTSNLRALCVDCHTRQAGHEHMRVAREDIDRVRALRWQQGLS